MGREVLHNDQPGQRKGPDFDDTNTDLLGDQTKLSHEDMFLAVHFSVSKVITMIHAEQGFFWDGCVPSMCHPVNSRGL